MASPAKTEATPDAKIHFTHEGVKYTIAPTTEWDLEVIEALEDDRIIAVVRAILGAEQWAKFKTKPRKVDDLKVLFEAISKASGLAGNS